MAQTHNHCPFCQSDLRPEEELWRCPSCGAPYHPECWRANRGCAVFGCRQGPGCRFPERPQRESVGLQPIRCPLCEREIADGQATVDCPDCGVTHHRDCWRNNGGCAAAGCTRAPRRWQARSLDDLLQPPSSPADVWRYAGLFLLFLVWMLLLLAAIGQALYVAGYCVGGLRSGASLSPLLPHLLLLAVLIALVVSLYRFLPPPGRNAGWLVRPPSP